MLNHMIMIYL